MLGWSGDLVTRLNAAMSVTGWRRKNGVELGRSQWTFSLINNQYMIHQVSGFLNAPSFYKEAGCIPPFSRPQGDDVAYNSLDHQSRMLVGGEFKHSKTNAWFLIALGSMKRCGFFNPQCPYRGPVSAKLQHAIIFNCNHFS